MVVPLGFDPERDIVERAEREPSAIGYFSRINNYNGFDKLVDAFIEMKRAGSDSRTDAQCLRRVYRYR